MRTKKEIRNGEVKRKILGLVIMGVAIFMLIGGYLLCEYKPSFIQIIENANKVIFIGMFVIWFIGSLALFFTGLMILFDFKIRHDEYERRDFSSRV